MRPWLYRVRVIGPSMEPSLGNGDVRWARAGGLRAGRVAVFLEPGRPDLIAVKRLVREVDGGWWVEGDAPDASRDSRHYGPVSTEQFLGTLIGRG